MAKKAAFTNIHCTVQAKLHHMQDSWLSAKAYVIQSFADRHNTKRFYDALKAVYGPQSHGSSPLLSVESSTLLTEKKLILERWVEHFNSMVNRPAQINDEAIARLPQVPTKHVLDIAPSEDDVRKEVKQLATGKAPGSDAIPAEVYNTGGPSTLSQLTSLGQAMWSKEQLPQELRDATSVHIYSPVTTTEESPFCP